METWLKEAIVIIVTLGGLEILLWWLDRKDAKEDRQDIKEQTQLLEDIAVSLTIREGKDESRSNN